MTTVYIIFYNIIVITERYGLVNSLCTVPNNNYVVRCVCNTNPVTLSTALCSYIIILYSERTKYNIRIMTKKRYNDLCV